MYWPQIKKFFYHIDELGIFHDVIYKLKLDQLGEINSKLVLTNLKKGQPFFLHIF